MKTQRTVLTAKFPTTVMTILQNPQEKEEGPKIRVKREKVKVKVLLVHPATKARTKSQPRFLRKTKKRRAIIQRKAVKQK